MRRRPPSLVLAAVSFLLAALALPVLSGHSVVRGQDEAAAAQPPAEGSAQPAADQPAQANTKLYELRLYTANAGKLPDLLARFRDHTMKLFEKHGIENVIYWTISEGTPQDDAPNMLVYIIAHKDQAAAEASWAAFQADPQWQEVKAKSEEAGPLLVGSPVSIFMKPTAFSPVDAPVNKDSDAPARVFELRKYNDGPMGVPNTVARFAFGEAELFRKHDMETLYFWTAADDSAFIYLLAHKDRDTAAANWQGFFSDFGQLQADFAARGGAGGAAPGAGRGAGQGAGAGRRGSGQRGGRGGAPRQEIRFLTPTDFSPRK